LVHLVSNLKDVEIGALFCSFISINNITIEQLQSIGMFDSFFFLFYTISHLIKKKSCKRCLWFICVRKCTEMDVLQCLFNYLEIILLKYCVRRDDACTAPLEKIQIYIGGGKPIKSLVRREVKYVRSTYKFNTQKFKFYFEYTMFEFFNLVFYSHSFFTCPTSYHSLVAKITYLLN